MNIILVMVMSVDGKITHGDDPHISSWTSTEDKAHFSSQIGSADLIVMGRRTYTAAAPTIRITPGKLRVILTRNPKQFHTLQQPGMLEFTDLDPKGLVLSLEKRGFTEMLLVGGSEINAAFFKAKLVNTLLLTIEPKLFGVGKPLIAPASVDADLTLVDVKKLNKRGTLLVQYTVIYP